MSSALCVVVLVVFVIIMVRRVIALNNAIDKNIDDLAQNPIRDPYGELSKIIARDGKDDKKQNKEAK